MDNSTDAEADPVAGDKLVTFMKSLEWGAATFPVMLATGAFFGTLLSDTNISSNWIYVVMIAVCGICGYGLVIWVVLGAMATLGQTPNARWYGVPLKNVALFRDRELPIRRRTPNPMPAVN